MINRFLAHPLGALLAYFAVAVPVDAGLQASGSGSLVRWLVLIAYAVALGETSRIAREHVDRDRKRRAEPRGTIGKQQLNEMAVVFRQASGTVELGLIEALSVIGIEVDL